VAVPRMSCVGLGLRNHLGCQCRYPQTRPRFEQVRRSRELISCWSSLRHCSLQFWHRRFGGMYCLFMYQPQVGAVGFTYQTTRCHNCSRSKQQHLQSLAKLRCGPSSSVYNACSSFPRLFNCRLIACSCKAISTPCSR